MLRRRLVSSGSAPPLPERGGIILAREDEVTFVVPPPAMLAIDPRAVPEFLTAPLHHLGVAPAEALFLVDDGARLPNQMAGRHLELKGDLAVHVSRDEHAVA